jgi:hypothetical protein
MREHKLYLWQEICEFEKTRIEYISHDKVEMDLVKKDCRSSRLADAFKQKEVPSFIGFVNSYQ